jgi:hypothetical protein
MAILVSTLSKQGRRIGDLAAGTMVLQERVPARPRWGPWMPAPLAAWASTLDLTRFDDGLALQVRQFLGRAQQFYPAAREELGHRLAGEVLRLTSPAPPPGTPGWAYLSAVLAERRHREETRAARTAGRPAPLLPIWPPPWPPYWPPAPIPYAGRPPAHGPGPYAGGPAGSAVPFAAGHRTGPPAHRPERYAGGPVGTATPLRAARAPSLAPGFYPGPPPGAPAPSADGRAGRPPGAGSPGAAPVPVRAVDPAGSPEGVGGAGDEPPSPAGSPEGVGGAGNEPPNPAGSPRGVGGAGNEPPSPAGSLGGGAGDESPSPAGASGTAVPVGAESVPPGADSPPRAPGDSAPGGFAPGGFAPPA